MGKLDPEQAKALKAEVDKKVEAGKTRLFSLQQEINAQEQAKQAKLAEVEAAVQRKSVELRDPLLKEIKQLEDKAKALRIANEHDQRVLDQRSQEVDRLDAELSQKQAEQSRLAEALGTFVVSIQTKQAEFARINNQVLAARVDKDKAQSEVSEIRSQIEPLQQLVEELEARRTALSEQQATELAQHEATLCDLRDKIKELDSKLTKMRSDYTVEQKRHEMEREDLAKRIMAADERDKVLRLRERKVVETERFIQDNAALLDL